MKKAEREALLQTGDERKIYTALDVGPTGKLLKPMGDLEFETAYEAFKEVVILGEQAGADLIHIETMSDTYELKAAVLAAKENTSLPVFATVIFDERKKLLTGADVSSVVALLEGLGVDALGINCAMGPKEMLPVLEELIKYSSVPIIVKPNAGLPKQRDGKTYYDVTEDEFAAYMEQIVRMGACVIGGCCGTTPEHIRAMRKRCENAELVPVTEKEFTISFFLIPNFSAVFMIFSAILTRPSASAGIPSSSKVRPITTPPYFFTRGNTFSIDSFFPLTELTIAFPL